MDDMKLYSALSAFRISQRDDPKSEKTANALRFVRRRVAERQEAVRAEMERVQTQGAAVLAEAEAFLKSLPADFEGTPEPDTIATYGMFGSANGVTPAIGDAQAAREAKEARDRADAINLPWLSR